MLVLFLLCSCCCDLNLPRKKIQPAPKIKKQANKPRVSNCNFYGYGVSISISSHLSLSSSSSSSSSGHEHDDLPRLSLYSDKPNPNPLFSLHRKTDQAARVGRSSSSPRMNSSGKIVFQSLERSSSSPSSFNGGYGVLMISGISLLSSFIGQTIGEVGMRCFDGNVHDADGGVDVELCCAELLGERVKEEIDMSRTWKKIDEEIEATVMPEDYQNNNVWILCNDTTEVYFHIIGQKCSHCKLYNTCTIAPPVLPQ